MTRVDRKEFGGAHLDGLLDLLHAVSRRGTASRSELRELSGLGRSTIYERVTTLLEAGLLAQSGNESSSGGRPADTLTLSSSAGLIIGIDVGTNRSRIGYFNLPGEMLAAEELAISVGRGVDVFLSELTERVAAQLSGLAGATNILSVGIGIEPGARIALEGNVGHFTQPGRPNDLKESLAQLWDAPVVVDSDTNVMAIGEHRAAQLDIDSMLVVKVDEGVGAGVILNGEIYRGHGGDGGSLGHLRVDLASEVMCTCGNTGCLTVLAGGQAIVRALQDQGDEVASVEDVVNQAHAQSVAAISACRASGHLIGKSLAGVVNVLNPSDVVIGGDLAFRNGYLLAGIREGLYQSAAPLVIADLKLTTSALGSDAGISGAAHLALDAAFERAINSRSLANSMLASIGSDAIG